MIFSLLKLQLLEPCNCKNLGFHFKGVFSLWLKKKSWKMSSSSSKTGSRKEHRVYQ